ncbi:MAG: T9SS type A sorting domain-containing protein [Fluviicola sp.]|nr:T9SS type A sorting domain-containing protein [Fluviicola sp.]
MRNLLIIASIVTSNFVYSQNYQLIPDSCTFCSFFYTQGGTTMYSGNYHINPLSDTVIIGNSYKKVLFGANNYSFGIRQVGNKLYGIFDTIQEKLIMDFDANVGDTISSLYDFGVPYYDARVTAKDSTLLSDGSYHHFMELEGIRISYDGVVWEDRVWGFKWNEKGLCNEDYYYNGNVYGGIIYNIPANELIIETAYAYPNYCTSDTLYSNANVCPNCVLLTSSLSENELSTVKIYPNPSNGTFQIEFQSNDEKNIRIYNSNGNMIHSIKSTKFIDEIDLLNIAKGVYFIQIFNSKNVAWQKIVIN